MNNENELTIITPVFNRLEYLKRLYNSLLCQNVTDFTWIIVDDGSTINLQSVINSWIKKGCFKIIYIREKNQGKMRAYQNATNYLPSDGYSIVVDSDDWVAPYTVDVLKKEIVNLNKSSDRVCGTAYPRVFKDNIYNDWNQQLPLMIDIIDLHYLYHIRESAILISNEALKYGFKKINFYNEKFLSEEVLYNQLISMGKFKVGYDRFYFSQYLESGLTNHVFELWVKNPLGAIELLCSRYKSMAHFPFFPRLRDKTKTILNLNALCLVTKKSILKNTPSKTMSILLLLPSVLVRYKRFTYGKK